MGDVLVHRRSFAGGEITPEFYGRIDDIKYQTGLALCKNFIVLPHGPVANRPGTKYVAEVKTPAKATRLLPFQRAFDDTLVIEFGESYFRFFSLGQRIVTGTLASWSAATAFTIGDLTTWLGVRYYCVTAHTNQEPPNSSYWYPLTSDILEVPHTYTEAQLADVKIVQSGDVITLVHKSHPPRELSRLSATKWTLASVLFAPTLSAPTGTGGVATPGATPGTPFNTLYVITALNSFGDESLQSASITVSNNLYDDGAYNTLSWSAVTGAARYNVYKRAAGLYGYIGQTDAVTFQDDNIASDPGRTPPLDIQLFNSANNYPGTVGYFDQRRVFAATITNPQTTVLTKSGTESNINYSIPAQEADSIQFKIAARGADAILDVVPMQDLVLTTAAGLWRVSGGVSELLSPDTITARQQTFVGATSTTPVLAGNNLIYAASRGGHLREFGFDSDKNGYVSGDVSIRAPHLFDGYSVERLAFSLSPWPIIWAVSSSGKLLGMTYVPEQQVGAWHQHVTDGTFEDSATVVENAIDVNYLIVQRTLGGVTSRFIEYMQPFASRDFTDPTSQYFVDCGATYDGAPATTISGLDWLEGESVSILADGAVVAPQTVVGGAIDLPAAASVVHVGLGYEADFQTPPVALEIAGYAQGRPKNVNTVFMRVYRSSGIFAGPSFTELREYKQRTLEDMGSPVDLKSEEVEIVVDNAWTDDARVCVRQSDPLALTVLSITMDMAIGGG